MYTIGLMSGTSMDGIDGALLKTDGLSKIAEKGSSSLRYEIPFHHALKTAEYSVRKHHGDLQNARLTYSQDLVTYARDMLQLSPLESQKLMDSIAGYFQGHLPSFDEVVAHSTDLHGDVVEALLRKSGIPATEVAVIGYHGQNLYHAPHAGITIQVGDAQRLAKRFQIPVISDFRKNDVLSGGQGAPFAPLYHQALCVRDNLDPAAVVNCGGVANVTFIQGSQPEDLSGFDTGPGNGLVDLYIKRYTQGQETYDRDGQFGLQGQRHEGLMEVLFASLQGFLQKSPPKSLDIADFSLPTMADTLPFHDVVRTLEEFTSETILRSLDFAPPPLHWILAGGGWKNPVIFKTFFDKLRQIRPDVHVFTANQIGWQGDVLEAQIFAYLAVRAFKGLPLSFPQTTGVKTPMCGGVLVTPQFDHDAH